MIFSTWKLKFPKENAQQLNQVQDIIVLHLHQYRQVPAVNTAHLPTRFVLIQGVKRVWLQRTIEKANSSLCIFSSRLCICPRRLISEVENSELWVLYFLMCLFFFMIHDNYVFLILLNVWVLNIITNIKKWFLIFYLQKIKIMLKLTSSINLSDNSTYKESWIGCLRAEEKWKRRV